MQGGVRNCQRLKIKQNAAIATVKFEEKDGNAEAFSGLEFRSRIWRDEKQERISTTVLKLRI